MRWVCTPPWGGGTGPSKTTCSCSAKRLVQPKRARSAVIAGRLEQPQAADRGPSSVEHAHRMGGAALDGPDERLHLLGVTLIGEETAASRRHSTSNPELPKIGGACVDPCGKGLELLSAGAAVPDG